MDLQWTTAKSGENTFIRIEIADVNFHIVHNQATGLWVLTTQTPTPWPGLGTNYKITQLPGCSDLTEAKAAANKEILRCLMFRRDALNKVINHIEQIQEQSGVNHVQPSAAAR